MLKFTCHIFKEESYFMSNNINDKLKKYLIIGREKCIGCGACIAATEGVCDYIDGKAWASKIKVDDCEEIISVCPVDCITSGDEKDYEEAKKKYDIKK